jgi:hypothetical protein
MNNPAFDSIFPIKIQEIISVIIDTRQFKFNHAVGYFYSSKLYEELADEETKLWHLSSEKLFEMLEVEKTTNKIVYPDFV